MTLDRINEICNQFNQKRIAVIGDVMLDHYLFGNVNRISPEAPVPIVEFFNEKFVAGGAANVAINLRSLGTNVDLFGICGNDTNKDILIDILGKSRINFNGILQESNYTTILKTRILANHQQILRIDKENKQNLSKENIKKLINHIDLISNKIDAIIISDYAKGIINQKLIDGIELICKKKNITLCVDPKPSHYIKYNKLTLLTPNKKELFQLAKMDDEVIKFPFEKDKNLLIAIDRIYKYYNPKILLITLGENGMLLIKKDEKLIHHIPTIAKSVCDVSGAGDTVISVFTLALLGGANPIEATIISNHAAGIVVGKLGTATVSKQELIDNLQLK